MAEESFIRSIETNNYFAVNLVLELGLVDIKTINQGLEELININACHGEMLNLLLTYGATIPKNIDVLLQLPDELFLENIYDTPFKTTTRTIIQCVHHYSKVKWDIVTENYDFNEMSDTEHYNLVQHSFRANKPHLFAFLCNIRNKKRYAFLLYLIKAYQDTDHMVFTRSGMKYFKDVWSDYKFDMEWDSSQIILCNLLPNEKLHENPIEFHQKESINKRHIAVLDRSLQRCNFDENTLENIDVVICDIETELEKD